MYIFVLNVSLNHHKTLAVKTIFVQKKTKPVLNLYPGLVLIKEPRLGLELMVDRCVITSCQSKHRKYELTL